MDDAVRAALAKWPSVPHVYGWLRLDRRGGWRLRDEAIAHAGLNDFLSRNYGRDEHGRHFVQNGPQRVYVTLDYVPWVVRLEQGCLLCHDGAAMQRPRLALIDDEGSLLLHDGERIALLDDRDLPAALAQWCDAAGDALTDERIELALEGRPQDCCWRIGERLVVLEAIERAQVAARFGFDPAPREAAA